MNITLNINDAAAEAYAEFKGYDNSSTQSVEECVTQALFNVVQNDLIEKRNRDAIQQLQDQPAPVVSPDQILTDDATASQEMESSEDGSEQS